MAGEGARAPSDDGLNPHQIDLFLGKARLRRRSRFDLTTIGYEWSFSITEAA
jgi:hypothetical protein